MTDDGDRYVGIRVRLLAVRPGAIHAESLDNPDVWPKWIPRSLIHDADEAKLDTSLNND